MAKIYSKLGKKSYKETRMIQSLENVLKAKFDADPQFQSNFVPAQNFDELKKMYETYCSEDVNFIEQTGTVESGETAIPAAETSGEAVEKERFIDPLNREAPKVRKYVMEDEFSNTENLADQNAQTKSTFDEPQTFEDSFSMPDDNTPKSEGKQKEQKQTRQDQPKAKQEPLNPEFDSMSAGKKKRSTKKFAKYIVEAVCMLAEKGFVWYANKDISEGKLAEYELSGEVELDLLVTMENDQQVTVKQFFLAKCIEAEHLAKIDPEEKSDLIDALAEVMLEKGVAPTPMQELMLITAKVLGGQVLGLLKLKSETGSVLNQLRAMKQGYTEYEDQTHHETPEPVKEQAKKATQRAAEPQAEVNDEVAESEAPVVQQEVIEDDLPIIDSPVTTIE